MKLNPEIFRTLRLVLGTALVTMLIVAAPVASQKKEIIQLQRDMELLTQSQRDLQRAVDEKHAVLKTLIEQTLDQVSRLSTQMGAVQKTMLDVQANTGARLDTLTTQVQAVSDNMDELKSRVAKLSQQMTDTQGTLQSLDAKIAGGAPVNPSSGGTPPPTAGGPPPSADVLYTNALRDFQGGKYDLSQQEFADYLKYYPETDLASNAQFYLGEILYRQKQYREAVAEYDKVLTHYPKSFKLAAARLKKGMALLELGQKASAQRELREVVRRYPGTEEARAARAKLQELGAGG